MFVVIISHREGVDVTVHQRQTGARDYLVDYCREWWDNDAPPPDDPEEVIALYFGGRDEHWLIQECAVYD